MKSRGEIVRELVKDPSLRVTDIAKQTGYNKGHVSRLRQQATKKEWISLTDQEIEDLSYLSQKIDESNAPWFDRCGFARVIEAKLKEKNA
jgi:N-acetylglutamate synthase-like GNAT family acetyltransferase